MVLVMMLQVIRKSHDHNDDSDDENCSFESKLQLDGFDIYEK